MLGANDIEESKAFYDATLSVLGARPGKLSLNHDGHTRYIYFVNNQNRSSNLHCDLPRFVDRYRFPEVRVIKFVKYEI